MGEGVMCPVLWLPHQAKPILPPRPQHTHFPQSPPPPSPRPSAYHATTRHNSPDGLLQDSWARDTSTHLICRGSSLWETLIIYFLLVLSSSSLYSQAVSDCMHLLIRNSSLLLQNSIFHDFFNQQPHWWLNPAATLVA